MVFLQSKNSEISTNSVIEWLLSFKTPFIRSNGETPVLIREFSMSPETGIRIILEVNGQKVDLNEISAYWHRRSQLSFSYDKQLREQLSGGLPRKYARGIYHNFLSQYRSLENYINHRITTAPRHLGNSSNSVVNKLLSLDHAMACGILVPDTCITGSKEELLLFRKEKGSIITKAILDSVFLWDDNENVVHYTELMDDEKIDMLPDTFALSLFQQCANKQLEIRSFFLRGTFYSMAIFSQSDKQTTVDFRKYNDQKPNRNIPFSLPQELEAKLCRLMELLKLDTGSIDLIYTQSGEYVFLEVNPVGQFAMVSHPCNYYIEKEIATYLSGINQTTPS